MFASLTSRKISGLFELHEYEPLPGDAMKKGFSQLVVGLFCEEGTITFG